MSLLFSHYDYRSQQCDHQGTLGQPQSDGSCVCIRCGEVIQNQETGEVSSSSSQNRMPKMRPIS